MGNQPVLAQDNQKEGGKQLNSMVTADEALFCHRILDYAKEFYKKPENQRAFEDWRARRNGLSPVSSNSMKSSKGSTQSV